jgi:hypothetical protein
MAESFRPGHRLVDPPWPRFFPGWPVAHVTSRGRLETQSTRYQRSFQRLRLTVVTRGNAFLSSQADYREQDLAMPRAPPAPALLGCTAVGQLTGHGNRSRPRLQTVVWSNMVYLYGQERKLHRSAIRKAIVEPLAPLETTNTGERGGALGLEDVG